MPHCQTLHDVQSSASAHGFFRAKLSSRRLLSQQVRCKLFGHQIALQIYYLQRNPSRIIGEQAFYKFPDW